MADKAPKEKQEANDATEDTGSYWEYDDQFEEFEGWHRHLGMSKVAIVDWSLTRRHHGLRSCSRSAALGKRAPFVLHICGPLCN